MKIAKHPYLYMVLVAFALRLAMICWFQTYRVPADFHFGYETGSVARSIAVGEGFSSPFGQSAGWPSTQSTGPTAWLSPLYPYLCAGVFRLCGTFTPTSAFMIFALNSLFSALTCIPLYLISERVAGRWTALLAGWTWAVVPFFMHWAITWVWEISLSALLLMSLLYLTIRLGLDGRGSWISLGLLWGVTALTNPALLSVLPVSLMWLAYRRRQDGWLKPVLAVVVCVAVMSPWLVRNRVVMGQWIFLRDNYAFEFHLANYHLSFGMGWGGHHPSVNAAEMALYRQLGERQYVKHHQRLGLEFVRQYPREFARLTLNRMLWFWDGTALGYQSDHWNAGLYLPLAITAALGLLLALFMRLRCAVLLTAVLLVYPAPYYLTYVQPRYRHAVEPIMVLFSAYLLVELVRIAVARTRPAAVANALIERSEGCQQGSGELLEESPSAR